MKKPKGKAGKNPQPRARTAEDVRLREVRNQSRDRLRILCLGIGHALTESGGCCGYEDVAQAIYAVNRDLLPALVSAQIAEEAYRPHWRLRRRRIRR